MFELIEDIQDIMNDYKFMKSVKLVCLEKIIIYCNDHYLDSTHYGGSTYDAYVEGVSELLFLVEDYSPIDVLVSFGEVLLITQNTLKIEHIKKS